MIPNVFLSWLLLLAFTACLIYALVQLIKAFRAMLSIPKHYQPGIKPWSSETWFNPYNGLILTRLLTATGKQQATEFWRSAGKFALAAIAPLVVALLIELTTGIQLIQG